MFTRVVIYIYICVCVYVVVYMASWETPEPYGDLSRKIADDNPKKVAFPASHVSHTIDAARIAEAATPGSKLLLYISLNFLTSTHNTPDFYIILEHSNLVVTPKVIQKVKSYLKMQHLADAPLSLDQPKDQLRPLRFPALLSGGPFR